MVNLPASEQEVFDIVVRGAHAQAWAQAADMDGRCMYRTPEGLKCHAGHLLPERVALAHNMESWSELGDLGVVPERHAHLIFDLQDAHDTSSSPPERARQTFAVGVDFGLKWPSDVPVPPDVSLTH